MSTLIGVTLALIVAAFGRVAGFDRDRCFYPTVLIVIASYYLLFATHWGALDLLESLGGVTVDRESRVVDDGVITSAGVASGIDMSFYVVEQLHGRAVADETAKYMEYRRVAL